MLYYEEIAACGLFRADEYSIHWANCELGLLSRRERQARELLRQSGVMADPVVIAAGAVERTWSSAKRKFPRPCRKRQLARYLEGLSGRWVVSLVGRAAKVAGQLEAAGRGGVGRGQRGLRREPGGAVEFSLRAQERIRSPEASFARDEAFLRFHEQLLARGFDLPAVRERAVEKFASCRHAYRARLSQLANPKFRHGVFAARARLLMVRPTGAGEKAQ